MSNTIQNRQVMDLPVLSIRKSSKPKLTFENSYWGKARADFIKYLETEKKINDPSEINKIVMAESKIEEAILSIEESQKKGEKSYGDKASKVLKNMHYFINLGDTAVKGGPESVGIVWMCFKVIFEGIQKDHKACQLLADISSTALGLMIQCRAYGALFDYHEDPTKDETGLLGMVQKCIRAAYLGILKFSYRAKTYMKSPTFWRELKAIAIDPNFKNDAANIDDLGGKLREFAGVAFQRRVDRNQGDMLENENYLIKIAEDQRNENRAAFEALKSELTKFADDVRVILEKVEILPHLEAKMDETSKRVERMDARALSMDLPRINCRNRLTYPSRRSRKDSGLAKSDRFFEQAQKVTTRSESEYREVVT